jgi:hypothetical protein
VVRTDGVNVCPLADEVHCDRKMTSESGFMQSCLKKWLRLA